MNSSGYAELSRSEKISIAKRVHSGDADGDAFQKLREQALDESEQGCYHVLGEPKSAVKCDDCCQNMALDETCATIKCFSVEDIEDTEEVHWDPSLICVKCADKAAVDAEHKIGVVVHGTLQRRRTRPGDPCSAPYVYYIEPSENPDVTIVTDVETDDSCYGCWG